MLAPYEAFEGHEGPALLDLAGQGAGRRRPRSTPRHERALESLCAEHRDAREAVIVNTESFAEGMRQL